jgi:hypothetical protein
MMVLTYAVITRDFWLLKVALEVDFDFGLGGVRTRLEAPAFDGIFCCCREQRVARFDLGFGDGAVGKDRDHQNDGSAYVHAAGKLGIAGRDAGDYGSVNIAGKGGSGAEEETSYDEKGTGRTE